MENTTGTAVFFDFDGVLVDSTEIKTEAYRELFKTCDPEAINRIIAHHQQHGGISRVDKITHARRNIIGGPCSEETIEKDISGYSALVLKKVIETRWIPGAEAFVRRHYRELPLFVISGTPEDELRHIIRQRGMDHYFRETLGSPIQKPDHVRTLVKKYGLTPSACFFVGDALTDYHAARETGVPFIGIRSEVEFPEDTVSLPDCTRLAETMAAFPR